MTNFTLGHINKAGLKHRKSRQWAGAAEGKGCETPLPVLPVPEPWKATQAAASSFAGGISVPCLAGRRGEPGSWGSVFPLHPSSAPSFCLPPFHYRPFTTGAEKITFSSASEESWSGFVYKMLPPDLAMWLSERRVLWGFLPKPKEVLSHIFLVSPQIFTLSSWSVVAMPAEEGFLTSRLKHKIDNQASWVLLNSTTYICIAYHSFFLFFAFFL